MENKTGVINVFKEKDYTSHDIVAIIKKTLHIKAGHTGTLDPQATGVLPVCTGRATKLADYFSASDKAYRAEIIFGIATDTDDIFGNILSRQDVSVDFEQFKHAAESFKYETRGEYMQTPPMYSAIKINGKKLYELARKGQTVERQPRPVKIFNISATHENDKYFLTVDCSKGTYIRGLCTDIGELLGCGAVMGELIRTRSGIFNIEKSFTLSQIKTAAEDNKLEEIILASDKVLPYPVCYVKPDGLARALNGNPLPAALIENNIPVENRIWLKSPDERIIGLYSLKNGTFRAEVML